MGTPPRTAATRGDDGAAGAFALDCVRQACATCSALLAGRVASAGALALLFLGEGGVGEAAAGALWSLWALAGVDADALWRNLATSARKRE